ncbi:MAG: glycosyltransferase [Hyphomicrobium sp.]|nr:glycosyltransferase [Hyphomicrobium sp.]
MTGNGAERMDIADMPFDGIICIGGEDWWYHNRGHFDFQVMRRLAEDWPVLFVNSIAVRMPSIADKTQFAAKFARKLKSLARGMVRVENNFWVFSPAMVPGPTGQKLSGWALAPQIKMAAARAGIKNPLLWIHCPAGASLIDEIPHAAVVMQRTDRFEAFPEADPDVVGAQIDRLKAAADLVVYCNAAMMTEEQADVKRQVLITHGVDLETFVAAGKCKSPGPADVAVLKRPRVGFIGGIDAHTFSPKLFLATASRLKDVDFALVGGCSLPEDWCTLPNVTLLGRKPYEIIASYMAAMDVLIMPWNDSDWIKACNPIKLKEYLAVGRPIVTKDFPALDRYRDLVRTAENPRDFAAAIRDAFSTPYDPLPARQRLASETWDAKAAYLAECLVDLVYEVKGQKKPSVTGKRSVA